MNTNNMKAQNMSRMCLTKARYRTYEFAVHMKEHYETKFGKPMRVYYCPLCMSYHLTSKV